MRIMYPVPEELYKIHSEASRYLLNSDEIEPSTRPFDYKLKENASEETKKYYKIFTEARKEILRIVKEYDEKYGCDLWDGYNMK